MNDELTEMFVEKIHPRFSETNAAGHVGFTALPVWFEKALDSVYRLFMPSLEPAAWNLIVVKFELQCLAEIDHINDVTIETVVRRLGNSSFSLSQSLEQAEQIKARAETTLVHFDYAAKKALPLGEPVRAMLEQHLQSD